MSDYPDQRDRFWTGRSVAVTGATGFVGHHLAWQLAARGARVTALVRPRSQRRRLMEGGITCVEYDLNDCASIRGACRGCEFVFHLAGAVDFAGDWQRLHRVNVDGTRNVITAARFVGVRRLVHTSSIVAVGAAARPRVLDESTTWNLGALRIPYVTTKRRAEELALASSDDRLEVVAVNPSCVVGPDDFSASEFGTLCRRFWRRRVPFYFGGGNNFVDVRDVADGLLRAAERGRPGQRYILGGGNRSYHAFFAELARVAPRPIFRLRLPTALADVVARVSEHWPRRLGARAVLTSGQARLLPWFFYFDMRKARHELGYQARPLAQSLADAFRFWMGPRQRSRSA